MKVLVAAEIPLYRDGVAEALRPLDDIESVATAASGAEAVLTARRTECDIVLLDLEMADSTQTVASLLAARPGLKVLALGAADDGPEVVASAEAGICGYISRKASLIDVAQVLRATMGAAAPISDTMAASGLLDPLSVSPSNKVRQNASPA